MYEIHEPVPESDIVHTVEEAIAFADSIGYPVVVRPAYTLGGTGGGFADTEEELRIIADNGLKLSPVHQCLIERSIAGFKEIEYEVMRDNNNNVSWSATWKTSIRWESIPVTLWLWLLYRRCPIVSIRCCAMPV